MVAFFSKKLYFLLVRKTTAQKNNNYISTNWETLFEAGIKNTALWEHFRVWKSLE